MARVKLIFPDKNPIFNTEIPISITHLNYGNHLGNDALLSIIHEARVRFLVSLGYSEINIDGIGLIMADTMISYKNEGFYGNMLLIDIYTTEISTTSFDLMYKVTTFRENKRITVAEVKTGMVAFNYSTRKIAAIPQKFLQILST